MNASTRTKVERAVLALLVEQLAKAGWKIQGTDDGDGFKNCKTERALFARVFNLDDCIVWFELGSRINWVKLVRGNSGDDLISDYGYLPDFDTIVKRVMKLIDSAPLRFVVKS